METSGLPMVQGPDHVLPRALKTSSRSSFGAIQRQQCVPMLHCEPPGQCGPDRTKQRVARPLRRKELPPFETPPSSGGLFQSVAAVFWHQVRCPFATRRLKPSKKQLSKYRKSAASISSAQRRGDPTRSPWAM